MWDLYARLGSEDGETLATAIDAHRTLDPRGTPTRELRTPEQRTADALADVIRAALGGPVPTSGGVRPRLNVVVPVDLLVGTAGRGSADAAGAGAAHGAGPGCGTDVVDGSGPVVVQGSGPAVVTDARTVLGPGSGPGPAVGSG